MNAMLEQTPVTLESLKVQANLISLESMNLTQSLKALPHRLPGFVADVKNFVTSIVDSKSTHAMVAMDTRSLERVIPKVNYVLLSEVSVFVPPSMDTDWMTFLDALDQSQTVVDKLMEETLTPFLRWISLSLTQPQVLSSARSKTGDVGIVFHDIEKTKKQIADCFSKQGADTKVNFGQVFKRNADFLIAIQRVNNLNERLAKINREEVVNTVHQITEALDKLLIRMKQYPDEYSFSGNMMNDLSRLSYQLGSEIEFFAAHYYMVQSASQAMKDTKEKVEDNLKQ